MAARDMVIQHVTETMVEAFSKGDLIDAQNMNTFLMSLEGMTDSEYDSLATEAMATAALA